MPIVVQNHCSHVPLVGLTDNRLSVNPTDLQLAESRQLRDVGALRHLRIPLPLDISKTRGILHTLPGCATTNFVGGLRESELGLFLWSSRAFCSVLRLPLLKGPDLRIRNQSISDVLKFLNLRTVPLQNLVTAIN